MIQWEYAFPLVAEVLLLFKKSLRMWLFYKAVSVILAIKMKTYSCLTPKPVEHLGNWDLQINSLGDFTEKLESVCPNLQFHLIFYAFLALATHYPCSEWGDQRGARGFQQKRRGAERSRMAECPSRLNSLLTHQPPLTLLTRSSRSQNIQWL